MKVVVADASPFVGLIKIGHVDVLRGLFGQVFVPPLVIAELSKPTQAQEVQAFAAALPPWLIRSIVDSRARFYAKRLAFVDFVDTFLIRSGRGNQLATV